MRRWTDATGTGAPDVRPCGEVALYVWDYAGKMELMRRFWDAAALVSRLIPCCFLVLEAAMAARGMVIKSDVASPTQ